jgi:hypothetical protein
MARWGDRVDEEAITWKMEVLRSSVVGRYEVALVEGHPNDLAWYRPGKSRGTYLLIRDDNKYYLAQQNPGVEVRLDIPFIESQTHFTALMLSLPLREGSTFGSDPAFPRDDSMYAWAVGQHMQVQLNGVKGVSPEKQFEEYELSYRALTDHQLSALCQEWELHHSSLVTMGQSVKST